MTQVRAPNGERPRQNTSVLRKAGPSTLVDRSVLRKAGLWQMTMAAGLVFLLCLAGCSVSFDASTVCSPDQRTELLNATLEPWTPSAPFTIRGGAVAWIQVTRAPESDEGLFGTVAGIAELWSVRSGATPNITTQPNGDKEPHDPRITVDKGLTWQELDLQPGAWQLYSFSNPGIAVVSCPQG
jgi:hypothetical protein